VNRRRANPYAPVLLTADGAWCPWCGWETETTDPYLVATYAAEHAATENGGARDHAV
jgi:hypothetical protein